ncbi:hypothetical protein DFH09DRAFT_1448163 [Mycena vulgaris]|nr:hypothetical protein DFH09DRAFT_1448163 [Mycena vulgaris]
MPSSSSTVAAHSVPSLARCKSVKSLRLRSPVSRPFRRCLLSLQRPRSLHQRKQMPSGGGRLLRHARGHIHPRGAPPPSFPSPSSATHASTSRSRRESVVLPGPARTPTPHRASVRLSCAISIPARVPPPPPILTSLLFASPSPLAVPPSRAPPRMPIPPTRRAATPRPRGFPFAAPLAWALLPTFPLLRCPPPSSSSSADRLAALLSPPPARQLIAGPTVCPSTSMTTGRSTSTSTLYDDVPLSPLVAPAPTCSSSSPSPIEDGECSLIEYADADADDNEEAGLLSPMPAAYMYSRPHEQPEPELRALRSRWSSSPFSSVHSVHSVHALKAAGKAKGKRRRTADVLDSTLAPHPRLPLPPPPPPAPLCLRRLRLHILPRPPNACDSAVDLLPLRIPTLGRALRHLHNTALPAPARFHRLLLLTLLSCALSGTYAYPSPSPSYPAHPSYPSYQTTHKPPRLYFWRDLKALYTPQVFHFIRFICAYVNKSLSNLGLHLTHVLIVLVLCTFSTTQFQQVRSTPSRSYSPAQKSIASAPDPPPFKRDSNAQPTRSHSPRRRSRPQEDHAPATPAGRLPLVSSRNFTAIPPAASAPTPYTARQQHQFAADEEDPPYIYEMKTSTFSPCALVSGDRRRPGYKRALRGERARCAGGVVAMRALDPAWAKFLGEQADPLVSTRTRASLRGPPRDRRGRVSERVRRGADTHRTATPPLDLTLNAADVDSGRRSLVAIKSVTLLPEGSVKLVVEPGSNNEWNELESLSPSWD